MMQPAVHNHWRLRAREDGEKPSPPRDCKADIFGACHCRLLLNRNESRFEACDGKAALMFCVIEESSMALDEPPSQETERNLNLGKYAMREAADPLIR